MPSATMMASRVTASAVATRAAPRAARGIAARRGAGAATGSGRWSSARQATLRVSRGSAARPVRPRSPPRRDPAAFPPRFERHLAIAARVPASRRVVDPILETPSAPPRRAPLTHCVDFPLLCLRALPSQLRAEQSSGKQVGSEDAVQEAASPKGEGEVLDLPSESAGETSAEPSLGDQIKALKSKGGSDPDASENIFVGAFEEVGQVEWPTVGGALSTTAVVIGIVVGSTFVLLSVNSVLSALSQKLFG